MTTPTCLNTASPLWLDVAYNNVSDGGNMAPAWGVRMNVGMPPQTLSIRPTLQNTIVVAPVGSCESSVDYACIAQIGGMYSADVSTTESVANESSWNSTLGNGDVYINYLLYNDVFSLGTQDKVAYGVPFATWSDPDFSLLYNSVLGLGPRSAFLQGLVDSNVAPFPSYGMWPGSRSVDNPLDGALVVGGYDSARVNGEFVSFPNTDICTGCISITELSWVNENGSVSLFNSTLESLQVAVEFRWNSLQVPQLVWETFNNLTGATYDVPSELVWWPTESAPTGSLSVTIKDGYTVNIPAEELIYFPREYDDSGALVVANETYKISNLLNYTNDDPNIAYLATWGLPFSTMNYFIMDVDKNEFRMAPAIRQDFDGQGGSLVKPLCSGTPEPPPPDPTPPPPPPPPDNSGSNTGAIVGGVVGGVGGIALILLAIFFCLRRRRRQEKGDNLNNTPAPPPTSYNPMGGNTPVAHSPGYPPPAGYHSPTYVQQYPTDAFGQQYPRASYPPMEGYKPQPGYPYPVMTAFGQQPQYQDPNQGGYYQSSPPLPVEGRGASPTQYSETATTDVHELANTPKTGADWRGSQGTGSVVTDSDVQKRMSATVTSPVEMPFNR